MSSIPILFPRRWVLSFPIISLNLTWRRPLWYLSRTPRHTVHNLNVITMPSFKRIWPIQYNLCIFHFSPITPWNAFFSLSLCFYAWRLSFLWTLKHHPKVVCVDVCVCLCVHVQACVCVHVCHVCVCTYVCGGIHQLHLGRLFTYKLSLPCYYCLSDEHMSMT